MLGVTAGTLLAFFGGYCHLHIAPWLGTCFRKFVKRSVGFFFFTLKEVMVSVLLKGGLIEVSFSCG